MKVAEYRLVHSPEVSLIHGNCVRSSIVHTGMRIFPIELVLVFTAGFYRGRTSLSVPIIIIKI